MRKIALLLILCVIFISCEKDYLIPAKEVPEWLKSKIRQDEKTIKDSPQNMKSYGGWLRYKWQDEYYFEYHNVLSSSMPQPVSAMGDTLHIYVFDTTSDYYNTKCCMEYVWKGPDFKYYPGIK
jgi:hypothetical protein